MARWWLCSSNTLLQPLGGDRNVAGSDPAVARSDREWHFVTQQAAALPRLQGLVQGRGPSQALFNGHSYRLGDKVAGYRLVAIHRDGVVLERDGRRHALLADDKVKIQ